MGIVSFGKTSTINSDDQFADIVSSLRTYPSALKANMGNTLATDTIPVLVTMVVLGMVLGFGVVHDRKNGTVSVNASKLILDACDKFGLDD